MCALQFISSPTLFDVGPVKTLSAGKRARNLRPQSSPRGLAVAAAQAAEGARPRDVLGGGRGVVQSQEELAALAALAAVMPVEGRRGAVMVAPAVGLVDSRP